MTDIHPLIRHNLLKKNIQSKVELESKAKKVINFAIYILKIFPVLILLETILCK